MPYREIDGTTLGARRLSGFASVCFVDRPIAAPLNPLLSLHSQSSKGDAHGETLCAPGYAPAA